MTQTTSRRISVPIIATILLVAVFYVLSLPENRTEVQDSLHNVVTVSEGNIDILLISNHLLPNALYYVFWQGMRVIGYTGDVELAMIILNIAASVGTLWVLALIMTRLRFPAYVQVLSLVAVSSAYAFWLHAVECEIYNLPIPFLLLSLHRLLLTREDPTRWSHVLHLAFYTTIAILLHQQHVLFALVLIAGLAVVLVPVRRAIGWSGVAGRIIVYGLTSMIVVMLAYFVVVRYVFGISDAAEMIQWARGQQAEDKWGYWSLLGPVKALIGFSRAFVGGHFVFALPGVAGLLQETMLRDYLLEEEVFMVRNFPAVASITLVLLTGACAVAALVVMVRIVRTRAFATIIRSRETLPEMRLTLVVSAAYLALYGLFNTWWEPQNSELWTSLVPFVVLSVGVLSVVILDTPRVQYSLGLSVGCLVLVNLFGSILPQQSREDDYWFQHNKWIIENARPDDVIVSGAGFISDGYLLLYTGAAGLGTWNKGDELEARFRELLGKKQPGRIFFSSSIASPPQSLVRRFKIDTSSARAFFERRRERLSLVHSDKWQQVYEYTPVPDELPR